MEKAEDGQIRPQRRCFEIPAELENSQGAPWSGLPGRNRGAEFRKASPLLCQLDVRNPGGGLAEARLHPETYIEAIRTRGVRKHLNYM